MSLEWNKANPERMKELRKKYSKSVKGKLKLKQIRKKYKNLHKEEIAKYMKGYRSLHKEELAKKYKEYKHTKQGRVIIRLIKKNHYFLKRTQGIGITNPQWDEILRKYNFRCAYCGRQGNMTQDHIIPVSKGGEHSPNNVVPACAKCNSKKQANLDWKPRIFKRVIDAEVTDK